MKLLPEHLNNQLERQNVCPCGNEELPNSHQSTAQAAIGDPEVDELVVLARRLQSAPHLQVDPDFAQRLETHILAHHTPLPRKKSIHDWLLWVYPLPLRRHPIIGIALSLCILLLLLGTSVLEATSHISHPDNPLYAVKRREQHMQPTLTNSPANRADLGLQLAQDQLNSLTDLARSADPNAYRQGLIDLDHRFNAAAQAIDALPAGSYQDHLASELAMLKADTRRTLRRLLLQLTLPERLMTTVELGSLGDSVPHLKSVEIILSKDPHGQATISITGDDLQPGAQLLVNGQLVKASGSLQNSVYIFVVNWSSSQLPQSIGILNPDGTATQTTAITLKNPTGHNTGKGKGSGNGSGNGSSNNHGKSEGKDSKNSSGNGHGNNTGKSKGKGSGISTSNGRGNNTGKSEGKSNGNGNGHGKN